MNRKKTLVLFDLDKTLITCDSLKKLVIFFTGFQKNSFFRFTKNKNDQIKLIKKYLNSDSLELFNKIIQIKTKKKNINFLHNYLIKKPFGKQYQSFLPKKISTFIDLGFYDGLTSHEFLRLFPKIKEIIAIEALV